MNENIKTIISETIKKNESSLMKTVGTGHKSLFFQKTELYTYDIKILENILSSWKEAL